MLHDGSGVGSGIEGRVAAQPRTADLDFVIVGGGILGTAVAALGSLAGYRILVLRLCDDGAPRADTLRNQGWLQSGLAYRLKDFASEDDYRVVAQMTYVAGREMLRSCDLTASAERGVLKVVNQRKQAETELKAKLLRLRQDEFRRLESDEARDRLQSLHEPGARYFTLPDAPFDEAGVLHHLRHLATSHGAEFAQLDEPVTLSVEGQTTFIRWGSGGIKSPLTLVAAGVGSLDLMRQLGHTPDAVLRLTPLLVHPGTCDMSIPLLVDLDRKFSAVRHVGAAVPAGAVVIGTKVRRQPANFALPQHRQIRPPMIADFAECLHPLHRHCMRTGRFTAGFELIPPPAVASHVEPWVVDYDRVVLASPGRATLALEAARKALALVATKVPVRTKQSFELVNQGPQRQWTDLICMHFADKYSFNDAEPDNA